MAMDNMTKCVGERREILRRVWYIASTAISKGYGVCYDRDYGTATSVDAERDNRVSLPDNTNNNSFAGVVVRDYAAKTGGQYIEIAEPGSVSMCYFDGSTTIGQDARLWASLLAPGEALGYKLAPRRLAYVHVIRGRLAVNGQNLATGDAAKIADEARLDFRADEETEFLLFDLPPLA